jgi:hypothetical protein
MIHEVSTNFPSTFSYPKVDDIDPPEGMKICPGEYGFLRFSHVLCSPIICVLLIYESWQNTLDMPWCSVKEV